jgi:hypothetical protein
MDFHLVSLELPPVNLYQLVYFLEPYFHIKFAFNHKSNGYICILENSNDTKYYIKIPFSPTQEYCLFFFFLLEYCSLNSGPHTC